MIANSRNQRLKNLDPTGSKIRLKLLSFLNILKTLAKILQKQSF